MLAWRLHLHPCHTGPSVDFCNCSDASGAGKVLEEDHLPSEDDVVCGEVFPLFFLPLLPGSYVWYLLLLTLWEIVCPKAVGILCCSPVHPGRLPSQKEKLSSPCTFHCIFADKCLVFLSHQHHHNAILRY